MMSPSIYSLPPYNATYYSPAPVAPRTGPISIAGHGIHSSHPFPSAPPSPSTRPPTPSYQPTYNPLQPAFPSNNPYPHAHSSVDHRTFPPTSSNSSTYIPAYIHSSYPSSLSTTYYPQLSSTPMSPSTGPGSTSSSPLLPSPEDQRSSLSSDSATPRPAAI